MLVRQGYRQSGMWTDRFHGKSEEGPLWSMALKELPNTRVLLFQERDQWKAVVSVAVGNNGEFPLCAGTIERKKDKFMPPASKMTQKIEEARQRILAWDFRSANPYAAQALARLTEYYMKKKHYRKARITNAAIISGLINAATVSEALSIVQTVVARTREDRLESALIWGEVYR